MRAKMGIEEQVKSYLRKPYTRMLVPDPEDGGYVAEVLELPGCLSQGETPEEAYRNLDDAMSGWIASSSDGEVRSPAKNSTRRTLGMSIPDRRLGASRDPARAWGGWYPSANSRAGVGQGNAEEERQTVFVGRWGAR